MSDYFRRYIYLYILGEDSRREQKCTCKGYFMNHLTRCKGCLIDGAVGDALGYPIEFMSQKSIFYKYSSDGLMDYVLTNNIAQISDDTQMTLFTADALACAKKQFPNNG